MLLWSVHTFGQSKISVFQLIKKPTEVVLLDSLSTQIDTIGSFGNVLGDSILISGIGVVSDTNDTHFIHVQIGNLSDDSFNIYDDSLQFDLIPTTNSSNIYRKGRVIYYNFGQFQNSDTLYGQSWLNTTEGMPSEIIYYPQF